MAAAAQAPNAAAPADNKATMDPLVTVYSFENRRETPADRPDEGVVNVFDSSTPVTNTSAIGLAPSVLIVSEVTLYNLAKKVPIDKASSNIVAQVKERARSVFRGETTGPNVGESARPYPLAEHLTDIAKALTPAHPCDVSLKAIPIDPKMWDSTMSGDSDHGARVGATLGYYTSKTGFDMPDKLYVAVQSTPGASVIKAFNDHVNRRISESTPEKPFTYGQLARSAEYAELIDVAKRNARRLLYEFIVECGYSGAIPMESDCKAVSDADSDSGEVSSPLAADPYIMCVSDVLHPLDASNVGYYSSVAPYAHCSGRASVVKVLHPAQGLAVYEETSEGERKAAHPARGYALTPKRGATRDSYESSKYNDAYESNAGGVSASMFAEERDFVAVDGKMLSQPAGTRDGNWKILQPVCVFIA